MGKLRDAPVDDVLDLMGRAAPYLYAALDMMAAMTQALGEQRRGEDGKWYRVERTGGDAHHG